MTSFNVHNGPEVVLIINPVTNKASEAQSWKVVKLNINQGYMTLESELLG